MTGTTTNGGRREDVSGIALRQSAYEHHCPKFIISTLIKPHKDKALYLTGKKPSSQQRKQDLSQRLPALSQPFQLIYSGNFSDGTENGDAMCANRASLDIPCSVNATFARKRARKEPSGINYPRKHRKEKNPSVTHFPRQQKVWKMKREPQL